MHQGRIEQIGAPHDVYEHPQTPFVEYFLGRILCFRGKIIEENGTASTSSSSTDAKVQVPVPESLDGAGIGKPVLVAIRPEDTRIESSDGGIGITLFLCDVENILHLGRAIRARALVSVAGFARSRSGASAARNPAAGSDPSLGGTSGAFG